jgi:hypothetical protein
MKRLALLLALLPPVGAQAQPSVVPSTTASIPISIAAATTTLLVTGAAGQRVYITAFGVFAGAAGTFQLISGTGATCAVGTINLTGAHSFGAAGAHAQSGSGNGAIIVAGLGHNVCAVTTTTASMAGFMAYTVF